MFDYGYEPWGENPPFHAPVFVHTHRGGDRIEKDRGTSYTFVTGGIQEVVDQAEPAADGKHVLIAGGVSTAQQALAARLVDEINVHITPVILGYGRRLLNAIGDQPIQLSHTGALGDGVVHPRYDVLR